MNLIRFWCCWWGPSMCKLHRIHAYSIFLYSLYCLIQGWTNVENFGSCSGTGIEIDLKSTKKITLGSKFESATLAPQYEPHHIVLSWWWEAPSWNRIKKLNALGRVGTCQWNNEKTPKLFGNKPHQGDSFAQRHWCLMPFGSCAPKKSYRPWQQWHTVKLYKTWISFSRAKDWIILIFVTMPSLPNFEEFLPMTQYPIFAKVLSSVWLDVPSQSICKENSIWIHLHIAKDDEILSTWCSLLTSQFFKGLLICNLGKTNLQTWIGIWDSVRIGVSLCAVV